MATQVILNAGVTSCRVRRTLPGELAQPLSSLLRREVFSRSEIVSRSARPEDVAALVARVSSKALASALAQDILSLALHLCTLLDEPACLAQLEVVTRDACRRFHHDFTSLRLLCTYAGPGTEWLEASNVDLAALDQLGGNIAEANLRIVRDQAQVLRAAPMDVVLLKGTAFAGHEGHGAVHRSPPAGSLGTPRLVLKLDALQHGQNER